MSIDDNRDEILNNPDSIYGTWFDHLESLAALGFSQAIEFLATVPHHGGRIGRSLAERVAIESQGKALLVKLWGKIDLIIAH